MSNDPARPPVTPTLTGVAALEQAADLSVGEMLWRLQDDQRREKIPDHVLAKLVGDINKLIERREAPPEDDGHTSMLDQLDGLPASRAIELLEPETARLKALYEDHLDALELLQTERKS